MAGILQEKYQLDLPANRNDEEAGWRTDASVRRNKGQCNLSKNRRDLPPGEDLKYCDPPGPERFQMHMSGETDVSKDVNPEAFDKGFTRRSMSPYEDQYTREHNDAFYDEITVDGDTGFVERNNVLDRM